MADRAWEIVRMSVSAFVEAFKGGWPEDQYARIFWPTRQEWEHSNLR